MITTYNLIYLNHYSFLNDTIFIVNNNTVPVDDFLSSRLCSIYSYSEITHLSFKNHNIVININLNNQNRNIVPFTSNEFLSLLDDNIYVNDFCSTKKSSIKWIDINPIKNNIDFGDGDYYY